MQSGGGLREIDADRSLPKTLEQGRQPSAELRDLRRHHENSRSARAICSKRSERAICVRHEPSVAPAAAMDSPSGRKLPGTMGSKGWMRCWRGRVGRHGAWATNVQPRAAGSSEPGRVGLRALGQGANAKKWPVEKVLPPEKVALLLSLPRSAMWPRLQNCATSCQ